MGRKCGGIKAIRKMKEEREKKDKKKLLLKEKKDERTGKIADGFNKGRRKRGKGFFGLKKERQIYSVPSGNLGERERVSVGFMIRSVSVVSQKENT